MRPWRVGATLAKNGLVFGVNLLFVQSLTRILILSFRWQERSQEHFLFKSGREKSRIFKYLVKENSKFDVSVGQSVEMGTIHFISTVKEYWFWNIGFCFLYDWQLRYSLSCSTLACSPTHQDIKQSVVVVVSRLFYCLRICCQVCLE